MPSALDLNLGATLIGVLLSSVLFGVVTVQVYVYFQSSFNDTKRTQISVTIIWIIECVSIIAIWIYLYDIMVTHYGHLEVLEFPHWALTLTSIATGIIGFIVQGYFAYRVFILSSRRIIPIIAVMGSTLQLAGCFALGILGHPVPITVFAKKYGWVISSVASLSLFTDALNTAAICYYLRFNKRNITSTNQALDKLFMWSIETGIVLSITALVILIFEQKFKGTSMWISVSLFYGKLYSNTLMASLNGRNFLRRAVLDKAMNTLDTSEGPSSTIRVDVQKTAYRADIIEMDAMDGRSKAFTTKRSSEVKLV